MVYYLIDYILFKREREEGLGIAILFLHDRFQEFGSAMVLFSFISLHRVNRI